ncbi:MAG TPA: hypothetical protein VFU99_12390 [Gaiellaceae bacterium]|nr:hypothetical protein [Gaiellaceae bacterium]
MKRLALVLVLVLATVAPSAASRPPASVACDSIIYPVGDIVWTPKRVVLGVVAVPPKHLPQTVETGDRHWPWWSKSGLVVRANSPPVLVSVPPRWRTRAAIGWGQVPVTSSLRIETCPPLSRPEGWNPYSGGFSLRTKAACVPLTFTVAGRSATVRFGVGKRCA